MIVFAHPFPNASGEQAPAIILTKPKMSGSILIMQKRVGGGENERTAVITFGSREYAMAIDNKATQDEWYRMCAIQPNEDDDGNKSDTDKTVTGLSEKGEANHKAVKQDGSDDKVSEQKNTSPKIESTICFRFKESENDKPDITDTDLAILANLITPGLETRGFISFGVTTTHTTYRRDYSDDLDSIEEDYLLRVDPTYTPPSTYKPTIAENHGFHFLKIQVRGVGIDGDMNATGPENESIWNLVAVKLEDNHGLRYLNLKAVDRAGVKRDGSVTGPLLRQMLRSMGDLRKAQKSYESAMRRYRNAVEKDRIKKEEAEMRAKRLREESRKGMVLEKEVGGGNGKPYRALAMKSERK